MNQIEQLREIPGDQPYTLTDDGDWIKITDGRRGVTLEKDRYLRAMDLKAHSSFGKVAADMSQDEYARVEAQVIRDFLTLEGKTDNHPVFVAADDYEKILNSALLRGYDEINGLVDLYGSGSQQVEPAADFVMLVRREQDRVARMQGTEPPQLDTSPCIGCGRPRSQRLIELGIRKCLACRREEHPELYREW
jgi:hypothetical protein